MDLVFSAPQYLVSLALCLTASVFFYLFLSPRWQNRPGLTYLATLGMMLGGLGITVVLYSYVLLKSVIELIYEAIFLKLIYRDRLWKCLLFTLLRVLLLLVVELLLSVLVVTFMGCSLAEAVADTSRLLKIMPLEILLYLLVFGIPCLFTKRLKATLESRQTWFILLLAVSQVVMMYGFLVSEQLTGRNLTGMDAIVTLLVSGLCIATDIGAVWMVRQLLEKQQIEQTQRLELEHDRVLLNQQKELRALRHDMSNHLLTIQTLLREDPERAASYAGELTENIRSVTSIDCDNEVAAAVLNAKAVQARDAQVEFRVSAQVSAGLNIRDVDLSSLLSNLLDNAIRGAKGCQAGQVDVVLRQKPGTLILQVSNTVPDGQQVDPTRSSKPNSVAHGQGTGIIRSIAERYEGSVTAKQEAGRYRVTVLLLEQVKA